MAGEYEKAVSIKEVIESINSRDYLLPAIQRKFVWSSQQICVLFDSIMMEYPINTFMMWEIKSEEIKKGYKFYEFLKFYCQRFNEENPHVPTTASFRNFNAIIDGQQRLTSLYIGLCGTYAYKQPRVWWPSTRDERILPPRKLHLDLMKPFSTQEDDALMYYNFKFLTDKQAADFKKEAKHHWFCMHDILNLGDRDSPDNILSEVVMPELSKRELGDNEFAQKTLLKLYDVIRSQKIIHYFKEKDQNIDHVLNVFIRTNSGGTKLDFADLLTSIAVAHWDGDFKKELEHLTKQIHQNIEMGFYIERDWILKTCLMLTDADVRFKVKNFKAEQVKRIQSEWKNIKKCIIETFVLVRKFGINPQSLTSKNAVIPLCYYLYKHKSGGDALYKTINAPTKNSEHREKLSQWLYMVLLKRIFGNQADSFLSSMRDVLDKNITKPQFPLDEIVDRYKATNKDLRFDDEYIESMLSIQHGERRCRALLHLLFPEMNATEIFHIDHLHPQSAFEKKKLRKSQFLAGNDELMSFYANPEHWNSIANLHLLNSSHNMSKNDRPLAEWIGDKNVYLTEKDLLVEEVDLDFENFKEFFQKRRSNLKERLKQRVFLLSTNSEERILPDFDEQVVEEEIV